MAQTIIQYAAQVEHTGAPSQVLMTGLAISFVAMAQGSFQPEIVSYLPDPGGYGLVEIGQFAYAPTGSYTDTPMGGLGIDFTEWGGNGYYFGPIPFRIKQLVYSPTAEGLAQAYGEAYAVILVTAEGNASPGGGAVAVQFIKAEGVAVARGESTATTNRIRVDYSSIEATVLPHSPGDVDQSVIEVLSYVTPPGDVDQSVIETVALTHTPADVDQSVIEILVLPGPTPPPPINPVDNPVSPGGPPAPRANCFRPNLYDNCLAIEKARWKRVRFLDLCSIPAQWRNLLPWEDEFSAVPPQAVPFRISQSITTPTAASGDNLICSLTVPTGYDGILTGFWWEYSGTGFVQGGGDILTRIQINRRYLKDLGNCPFLLGSPASPFPLTEGQVLLSHWTVNAIVNVPNTSGSIQVGTSKVTAALYGFFWPRYLTLYSV